MKTTKGPYHSHDAVTQAFGVAAEYLQKYYGLTVITLAEAWMLFEDELIVQSLPANAQEPGD